jgi:branched-chain amino acid transport system permease protein
LLFAGVALIVTLILNPEGVAGANYKKAQQRRARRARATAQVPETTPSS